MHAMTSRGSQPPTGKSSFRDKRYTMPSLLVDLLSGVYETRLWSSSQLILRDFTGDLAAGEDFTGTFTFDDEPACGLFQARAVRGDPARRCRVPLAPPVGSRPDHRRPGGAPAGCARSGPGHEDVDHPADDKLVAE